VTAQVIAASAISIKETPAVPPTRTTRAVGMTDESAPLIAAERRKPADILLYRAPMPNSAGKLAHCGLDIVPWPTLSATMMVKE
jgi:hypothetical protein